MIDDVLTLRVGALPLSTEFYQSRGQPIPPDKRRIGCDVSRWNGVLNHQTMQDAGARFVYIKATQGTAWVDPQLENNRRWTLLPYGLYHYLTLDNPISQADHFVRTYLQMPGVLPPVLDVELPSVNSSAIKQYVSQVYNLTGQYPMIYTSSYFWGNVTGDDKPWITSHCPLWVAHWGTDFPLLPSGWTTYAVHQYSADGNGLGPTYGAPSDGDHDMDLNRCSVDWLNQYVPVTSWQTEIDAWARTHGYTGVGPEAT